MIKEVIVVEGKCDIVAVQKAVDADCIATGGYSMLKRAVNSIEAAYIKRGIIIFTDPDSAGERIRKYLTDRFSNAKQAYLSKEQAKSAGDIGVECASVDAIRAALDKTHCSSMEKRTVFSVKDIYEYGLVGNTDSSTKRAAMCESLGLGYCNAKQFVERLNNFGITREELAEASLVYSETREK
ncbi:MAG: ribonuclease M5 [Negativicutes bacterium]|jgi:ribonuclease M5